MNDDKTSLLLQEREDWERNAEFYLREVKSPLYALLHSKKVATYGLDQERQGLRVLDLGGGTGYFSVQLANWGHIPITLDLAINMLRLGQTAYALPSPVQAAVPPLPFRDASFDAVVSNGVLHHFKAQGTLTDTIREIYRVLKPDGLVLIYDRNGAFLGRHLHHLVISVRKCIERHRRIAGSASANEPDFNDADIACILQEGFRIERRRYVSTLFTFLAIVIANSLEYAGYPVWANQLRRWFAPFLKWTESVLDLKSLTVEQCLRLRKRTLAAGREI